MSFVPPPPTPGRSLVSHEPATLVEAYRVFQSSTYNHTQSGGTFNHVAGNQVRNEYKYNVAGNFIQSHGENGINLLQRNISGDSLHNSEQRFPPPLCHPDTRTAVQNIIQAWAADTDRQAPSVMWLYGPAGAGKSAVAQSMAENWAADNQLAASFFFARWRAGGSSGKTLFPTIAYQLALHIPGLRTSIGLAVEADPAICDKSLEDQVDALLVNPITLLPTRPSRPYLIIIDGLDECSSKPTQSRIIKIIFQAVVEAGLPMRFLICSRPEPHIRETFDSSPGTITFRRLILDDTFNPGRDILRYLRDRFSEIRRRRLPYQDDSWPPERDLERLVHNASGQFIYAATVLKFVDDEYCHPMDQLFIVLSLSTTSAETGTSPFSDLDTLYTYILSANPNISLMMRILGAFFAIPNPTHVITHSVGFLDGILALRSGSVRFALRGLHSILFIPDADDHRIRVHHASLHDFLSNPERAGRFYLSQDAHLDLARCCFSIVLNSVRSAEQYTVSLINYCHKNWMYHCPIHWIDPEPDIPGQEQPCMIQQCLRCFRDVLSPEKLAILCDDTDGMIRRFLRIIDFLSSFQHVKSIQPELSRDVDDTWNTLLTALFDPIPAVARFYEGWAIQHHGLGFDISSSLGIVFQHLWPWVNVNDPKPPSYKRVDIFLSCRPSLQIRRGAAEISMHLLMCRNAEIHACIANRRESIIYIYHRNKSHWNFTHHWCTNLTQAAAAAELLAKLRVLIQNTFFAQEDEIEDQLLKQWLDKLPRDLKTQGQEIYTAIKAARPIIRQNFWENQPAIRWFAISFPNM